MKRVSTLLLGVALLLFGATECKANLIAFNAYQGNQQVLKVMDESGANVREIYRGDIPATPFVSISPAGPNGTWVAFPGLDQDLGNNVGLYKVHAEGGEPIKVLCSRGTDSQGDEYWGVMDPQWSPDGAEILVRVRYPDLNAEAYALLTSSDFTVPPGATGADCAAPDLERLEYFDTNEVDLGYGAAWNHDASEIAFFERNLSLEWRLTILRRGEGLWSFDRSFEIYSLPGENPHDLDWQRGGDLLAFMTGQPAGPRSKWWLLWVDAREGYWDFFYRDGNRVEGRSPSWSPDDSQLVYSTLKENVYKWDFATGDIEQLTAGSCPDWQRDPLSTCSSDTECGEGELCDTGSGVCFVPECGALNLPECEDFDDCTVDTCIDYQCNFDPAAAAGLFCDDGDFCTEEDVCDGSGVCEGTLNTGIPGCEPPSCGAVGDSCDSGADCCSGLCHPKKKVCK